MINSQYLTVKEAASFLRVKESTIYSWVHSRKIPFRKHGRKLVFEKENLVQWSDNRAHLPYEELTFNCFGLSQGGLDDSLKTEDEKTEGLTSRKED